MNSVWDDMLMSGPRNSPGIYPVMRNNGTILLCNGMPRTKRDGRNWEAIRQVRQLDLSESSREMGWSPPQAATDDMECHPYMTYNFKK